MIALVLVYLAFGNNLTAIKTDTSFEVNNITINLHPYLPLYICK